MADNRQRKSATSIFTNVAVAAPIAICVGVGARSLLRTMNASQLQIHTGHGGNFLRNFAAKIGGTSMGIFSGDLSIMNGKSPEMIQMAWEMALSQADPGKILKRVP